MSEQTEGAEVGIGAVEDAHQFLADHFIMWRALEPPNPPGEWFCTCGLKFGFSDSAINHVATLIAGREAKAWDEGYGAGRDDEGDSLPLRSNPYRGAVVAARGAEGGGGE